MVNNDLLDDHLQIGNSEPTDSYRPGTATQLVDLDELFDTTNQSEVTQMVSGLEEFKTGLVSPEALELLGIDTSTGEFDPHPSKFNAVAGAEGFLSTILESFRKAIEWIIKYVRKAIDWVLNTVKTIFGFKNSKRQEEVINSNLDPLKEEFEKTIVGLGLDPSIYNVSNFIGTLPKGNDRYAQIRILSNKLGDDLEAIKRVGETLPLITEVMQDLKKAGEMATISSGKMERTINDEYKKFKYQMNNGTLETSVGESTIANRVLAACMELSSKFQRNVLLSKVINVFESLYGIEFTNQELGQGLKRIQEELNRTVEVRLVNVKETSPEQWINQISTLNRRYVEIKDRDLDLSSINWRAIGNSINNKTSVKVEEMATVFRTPLILEAYQEAAIGLRDYVNSCHLITKELLKLNQQIKNLIGWYGRVHTYYYSGVLGDIETMKQVIKAAKESGASPLESSTGGPPLDFVSMNGSQPTTVTELFGAHANFLYEADTAGVKTALETFKKQVGF